ncbi:MAG: hypothetical protein OXE86_10710 [Alphaproteobacteria bacterium]|nr:hypothetical protein [Alphaproteobacteria bacterium]
MTRERGGRRRVRLTISCPDLDWERIREAADRRGLSINKHMIGAGLSVELGDDGPGDGSVALSAREQRELFDRVARLADVMVDTADDSLIPSLHRGMRLIVMAVLHDMVNRGRDPGPVLREVFGTDAASAIEREFQTWLRPELDL